VDTSSGAPVVSTFGFSGVPYRARPVLNPSLGGHVRLSPAVNLSAGVYLDQSPWTSWARASGEWTWSAFARVWRSAGAMRRPHRPREPSAGAGPLPRC